MSSCHADKFLVIPKKERLCYTVITARESPWHNQMTIIKEESL
ncbi:hypothetical protein SAMN02910447_03647 [Ruminococcus sp. YE71]|nr:hypothetical protein SAMN02910446_03693 [Ruminococcus sp. YE78]SFW54856.1 hypothetical protein SAMN02910447_03647 [Ruminococcus sp. YE71]